MLLFWLREGPRTMHEMGIAQSVLDAARAHVNGRVQATLRTIGLRVGELSGVDRESLAFCFECLVKGTPDAHVRLDIEWLQRSYRCPLCGLMTSAEAEMPVCGACGDVSMALVSGDELEVAWLELEEES